MYDVYGCEPQFRISAAPRLKSEIAVVLELLEKVFKRNIRLFKIREKMNAVFLKKSFIKFQ